MFKAAITLIITLIFFSLTGCGPIQSTALVIEAEVNLESARAAGAERYSPYEYYSAFEYLKKSKEKQGQSKYERSIDYATIARDYAKKAERKSVDKQKKLKRRH